jgi:hypothetical protein
MTMHLWSMLPTKHLCLRPAPSWAAMNPDWLTVEGWNSAEARAALGVPILALGERDPHRVRFPLSPTWEDPPPLVSGTLREARWHTVGLDLVALVRGGLVTLCGQQGIDAHAMAPSQGEATCVDCLAKLEKDREIRLASVVPYEHKYRMCQMFGSPMCLRCAGTKPAHRRTS